MRLRAEGMEWREIEGQVVVVDRVSGNYVAVNASGALLWPMLAGGASREALVEALGERYGLAAQTAARDVDAFLDVLDGMGLLERDASA